eukprot:scaffold112177_cov62-Phaeocystis_antarctica.AAC.3
MSIPPSPHTRHTHTDPRTASSARPRVTLRGSRGHTRITIGTYADAGDWRPATARARSSVS